MSVLPSNEEADAHLTSDGRRVVASSFFFENRERVSSQPSLFLGGLFIAALRRMAAILEFLREKVTSR